MNCLSVILDARNLLWGFLLFSFTSYSQYTLGAFQSQQVQTDAVSAYNPWITAAKLSYSIQDPDGTLKDNFLFAGKTGKYLVKTQKYGVPMFGSFDLNSTDILSNESGINLGIYPYYVIANTGTHIVLHSGITYKMIPETNTVLVKITGGIEFLFFNSEFPTTFSVAPVFPFNRINYIEFTYVHPFDSKMGIVIELQQPYYSAGVLRIGLITVL